ncbi:hypothetical protein UCRPA7_2743 [Phaeoacremonium minimum UCRPA7]|uniref:Uncharacterized protein n=1 Tax=Phaeoacremonium minimum (strain UCR-PA7) TaxID=1286976 RepID=R8BQV3_PHAM7|nr:hypothetical protein UCRPA7_2743 [Phaeoacremonium minimum UCRPA7]EOO01758.1 hypothetical protein UCRPA7_2743 [Phaeoacremonium minimum UCRPA7]
MDMSQIFDKVVCQVVASGGATYSFGGDFPDRIEFASGSQISIESYSCGVSGGAHRRAIPFGEPSFVPFIPEPTPSSGLGVYSVNGNHEATVILIEGRQEDATFVPSIPKPTPSDLGSLPAIPEETDEATFVPVITLPTPSENPSFIPIVAVDDFAAVLPVPERVRD